jgi:membrane associated rhomboid family serine protease
MIPLKDDNASGRRPYVTVALIVTCTAVFLWQQSLDLDAGRRVVDALGAIPAVLLTDARLPADLQWIPRYGSPFTSMFLHAGWLHLCGNMLYLWIYGDNVEDSMGHGRYVVFYLVCGAAAVGTQALSEPQSAKVLTLVLLPFFFTTLKLPAMLLLLLWFAAQLVSDLAARGGGSAVAFGAHIGGFLVGMLLVPFLKRREVTLFSP